MTATVLPELAAESVETAERLGRLSAEPGLDFAEAEYILASRLAAIQLVSRLWPMIRARIGRGMIGPTAHEHLAQLLDAVDKNLALAATLKEPARIVREHLGHESEAVAGLAAAETQLRQIRAEAVRLLKIIDAPARWPAEEQLRQTDEQAQQGQWLTADEFRQALLGE